MDFKLINQLVEADIFTPASKEDRVARRERAKQLLAKAKSDYAAARKAAIAQVDAFIQPKIQELVKALKAEWRVSVIRDKESSLSYVHDLEEMPEAKDDVDYRIEFSNAKGDGYVDVEVIPGATTFSYKVRRGSIGKNFDHVTDFDKGIPAFVSYSTKMKRTVDETFAANVKSIIEQLYKEVGAVPGKRLPEYERIGRKGGDQVTTSVTFVIDKKEFDLGVSAYKDKVSDTSSYIFYCRVDDRRDSRRILDGGDLDALIIEVKSAVKGHGDYLPVFVAGVQQVMAALAAKAVNGIQDIVYGKAARGEEDGQDFDEKKYVQEVQCKINGARVTIIVRATSQTLKNFKLYEISFESASIDDYAQSKEHTLENDAEGEEVFKERDEDDEEELPVVIGIANILNNQIHPKPKLDPKTLETLSNIAAAAQYRNVERIKQLMSHLGVK